MARVRVLITAARVVEQAASRTSVGTQVRDAAREDAVAVVAEGVVVVLPRQERRARQLGHDACGGVGALGAIVVLRKRRGRAAGLFEPHLAVAAADGPVVVAAVRSSAVGRARTAQLSGLQVHKVVAAVVGVGGSDGALGLHLGRHSPRARHRSGVRRRAFIIVGTWDLVVVGRKVGTRLWGPERSHWCRQSSRQPCRSRRRRRRHCQHCRR